MNTSSDPESPFFALPALTMVSLHRPMACASPLARRKPQRLHGRQDGTLFASLTQRPPWA
jgi:hypothetical protein